LCLEGKVYFNVGAGIVSDSSPDAEYEETMAKAAGFIRALQPGLAQPVTIATDRSVF